MAGQGPGLGQPADTRLVLTSDTGFAIRLYSVLKYEIWASPILLMQGSGRYLRSGQDLNHPACKTKSLFFFFFIQLFLFSVLEIKKKSILKLKCVGLKLMKLCVG